MAGGVGRPGSNIAAGMPQGQAQQGAAPMPTTQPAISPMQQYMQSVGITRSAFNPMARPQGQYAMPRPVPQFQPQLRPNMPAQAPAQQQAPQAQQDADAQRAYDMMRANGGTWSQG